MNRPQMHWHRKMSIQGGGSGDSDDLFVQVQSAPAQASSQRHVGFGQETDGFLWVYLQDQMIDGVVTRRFYTCTCMECDSTRDWQDVKEPSPSQTSHRASRKGRDSDDSGALLD